MAQKRDNEAGHIYFYQDKEHCEHLIAAHRRKLLKATLVIGDERVFTQSEVRAMADEVIDAAKEECNTVYRSDEEAEAEMSAMLGRIFARHGLSDPA